MMPRTLQGQVGHAADKSLLLCHLFIFGFVLLHNGEERVIQSSLRKDVISVLLRKGKVGDWKNYMEGNVIEMWDTWAREEFNKLNIENHPTLTLYCFLQMKDESVFFVLYISSYTAN